MATTIKLKNGSGAPLAGDLVAGEPALDLTNKRLYTEDSGGTVIEVGTNPGASGAVTLNHSGSAKLTTTSTGIDVTGSITTDGLTSVGGFISIGADGAGDDFRFYGDTSGRYMEWVSSVDSLLFRDSAKAVFGTGSDLQIYHDGLNSYISDTGIGDLYIKGSTYVAIQDASGNNTFAGQAGGASYLYYAGSGKLATTSTGIDVTGTVVSDGLTVSNAGANADITLTEGSTNTDARIRNSNGILQIGTDINDEFGASEIQLSVDGKEFLTVDRFGDISFYEDTGTTAKLFWDASAESLGLGTSSPQRQLHVNGSTGALRLQGTSVGGYVEFVSPTSTSYIGHPASISSGSTDDFGFYVAGTERMRIDSSGNLSITSSGGLVENAIGVFALSSGELRVKDSTEDGTAQISIYNNNVTSDAEQFFVGNNLADVDIGNKRGALKFFANSVTERMRIDSSGNLLVGKTSAGGVATVGAELRGSAGYVIGTASSDKSGWFGRNSTDGDIVGFYKDGTTVGSIGTVNGDLLVGTGDTGLRFHDTDNRIYPINTSGGTKVDATIDLGDPTGRFKDLYLSGGAYLGGTAAANHLDDYEEGTFTATLKGSTTEPATLVTTTAKYTKVGNLVSIAVSFENIDTTGYAGQITVTGVPFVSNSSVRAQLSVGHYQTTTWNTDEVPVAQLGISSTTIIFQNTASGAVWSGNNHNAGTTRFMWATGTYIAA